MERLTSYASGGGCACKIPPGELEDVVRGLTGARSPDLLVGLDDGDDAAVVRIDAGTAVVVTADFFPPVVDDAYDWGRIAAANALSDVYAMGGRPVIALNLLAFSLDSLGPDVLREILRGGSDRTGTPPSARDRSPGPSLAAQPAQRANAVRRNSSSRVVVRSASLLMVMKG